MLHIITQTRLKPIENEYNLDKMLPRIPCKGAAQNEAFCLQGTMHCAERFFGKIQVF